eukprot:5729554-Pyramimonas_sp.AAC.1
MATKRSKVIRPVMKYMHAPHLAPRIDVCRLARGHNAGRATLGEEEEKSAANATSTIGRGAQGLAPNSAGPVRGQGY